MAPQLQTATPVLYNGADAAFPGARLPEGTDILNIYIGAEDLPDGPDTPHIWTIEEANEYVDPKSSLYGGPDLVLLPNFVHNFPADPVLLADNACDAAVDMGWSDKLGRIIVLDTETLTDPAYVWGVAHQMNDRGFRLMDYGSYSFVMANGFPLNWPALLTPRRPTILPARCAGQQWNWGPDWDLSVFNEFVYKNCGRGLRKREP